MTLDATLLSRLSVENQALCRRIDKVWLVGKKDPTALYTWDFWTGEQHDHCSSLSPLHRLRTPDQQPPPPPTQQQLLLPSISEDPQPPPEQLRPRGESLDRPPQIVTNSSPETGPKPKSNTDALTTTMTALGSPELARQRTPYEYCRLFEEGEQAYEAGNWTKATATLLECQRILPGDHPARLLIGVMSRFNFNAPHDWKGSRVLREK